jgi:hypothetical protein
MRIAFTPVVLVALVLAGCATARAPLSEADQHACDKLVDVVRASMAGSAYMDAETAQFATRKGLGVNIAPAGDGRGYNFLPRAIPFSLLAAAGVRNDGWTQYRSALDSRNERQKEELATAGRRCEW